MKKRKVHPDFDVFEFIKYMKNQKKLHMKHCKFHAKGKAYVMAALEKETADTIQFVCDSLELHATTGE